MNHSLQQMSNVELKAYIKANRKDEKASHEALKILLSRRPSDSPKYPFNLPEQEMEAIFKEKQKSLDSIE